MRVRQAVAVATATVLGVAMMATGPAFADGGHGHHGDQSENRSCSGTRTSEQDREWLKSSIQGDYFEITGGQMAQSQAVDAMTKALGARLKRDHTETLQSADALAMRLGITPPKTMSEKQRDELEDVARDRGLHFDDEYSELEITDHMGDIRDAKHEIADGCNMMVRDEARTDLPILETHLSLSKQTSAHIETLPGHEGNGGGEQN